MQKNGRGWKHVEIYDDAEAFIIRFFWFFFITFCRNLGDAN